MLKTKLSQAIAFAMTGFTITAISTSDAAAAATVSYNAFNHDRSAPGARVSGGNGTDGWMTTATNACGSAGSTCGDGPNIKKNPIQAVPWVGNDARTDANFDYSGTQTLNWTTVIGAGDTAVVSRLDSNTRYGGTVLADGTTFNYADIDTAKGAWHDGTSDGWKHDTDIGLFKSNVTQTVTLSISSLLSNGTLNETPDYGFTVFEGKNTGTTNYSHHGSWHSIDPASAQAVGNNDTQITDPNPFGGSGLTTLILDDVIGNSATFTAEAGKIYTIMLGGFQGGDWGQTRNDYQLTIAAVPVPGAVWLFGSALTGFIGFQRRKRVLA
jgi:hypothetical protein